MTRAMHTQSRSSAGIAFLATLLLSWTLVTGVIGVAIWVEREKSFIRLATWLSLWAFSVLGPTLNALAIHRSLENPAASVDQLARLRPFLLLYANMVVLSAFALIFGH